MSKIQPDKEADIDIFFKSQLENANEESALQEMSWTKISNQLDILSKLPVSGSESVTSATSAISHGTANTFVSSIITIKGLLISGTIIATVGIASNLYFSPAKNELAPIIENAIISDSLNKNTIIETTRTLDSTSFESQIIAKEKTVQVLKTQRTDSDAGEDDTKNIVPSILREEPGTIQEEVAIPEKTIIAEKENTDTVRTNIEPVKDFRQKQLEKSKKKTMPIFTPENEK